MIGYTIYVSGATSKFILLGAICFFLYRIIKNGNKNDEVLFGAAYVTGFEVLSRMTGGAFTYEFAKYAVIGFLVLGMFYRGFTRTSWPYVFYLFLLIPGVLFSAINLNYNTDVGNAIGFNLSGPVCLGISALYCYNRKIPKERFASILHVLILPIISITIYLYFYTPSIRDALEGTASNFAASGGYGPNQVATVLGLGMFILFARLLTINKAFINIIDLLLLALVSYRGIVTFSRGGIITAAICALVFLIFLYFFNKTESKRNIAVKVGVTACVIFGIWVVSSITTLGLIDKRYSNENAAGELKEDITTGRSKLIASELEAFYEYPITGIGVGKVKEYRQNKTGVLSATHNELSRLLSEHGVFGFLAIIILLITPVLFWFANQSNPYLFAFLAFWFLTINHSSMRIAAPAFIYGLALLNITYEKKKKPIVHRE
ncbi:O-antigen ligase family protein [uncultured Marixanthomonas sp.]|uniref:O-antigen ligase family protein n=1 Tax=uncultured Marixanthomonas sp. TaxID=757245 RepID=UPI0030D8C71C